VVVTSIALKSDTGEAQILRVVRDETERAAMQASASRRSEVCHAIIDHWGIVLENRQFRFNKKDFLNRIRYALQVDAVGISIHDNSSLLKCEDCVGFDFPDRYRKLYDDLRGTGVNVKREVVHSTTLQPWQASRLSSWNLERFTWRCDVPIYAGDRFFGMLEIYSRDRAVDASDLYAQLESELTLFSSTLAATYAVQANLGALNEAKDTLDRERFEYIEAVVKLLHGRDEETEEHTRRVVDWATKLASFCMDAPLTSNRNYLTPEDVKQIRIGALLHDIGKIGTPDAILYKEGALAAVRGKR
jgi:hypothetical protein